MTELFHEHCISVYVFFFYFSFFTRMTEVEMKDGKGQVTILRKELAAGDSGRKEKGQVAFLRKESKEERVQVAVFGKEMKEEKGPVAVVRQGLGHGCDSV